MIIAFDFDGTLKRVPGETDRKEAAFWLDIMDRFTLQGWQVIVCTMRRGHYMDQQELMNYGITCPIVYAGKGSGNWKREACKEAGYRVNVWVDDQPEMIGEAFLLTQQEKQVTP